MSPLVSERPFGRHRKLFDSKALRLFYVPFVDQTEARQTGFCLAGSPSWQSFHLAR